MNKPNSLYIHIPFCENLCDYCDFPKLQYFRIFAEQYLIRLKQELDSYHIDHKLKTIYVGGGTPTVLDDDLLEELLKIIHPYIDGVVEYTFEANPETLNYTKLALLKRYGVNRLSIGVESTNDDILKAINRHHTFLDVKNAVILASQLDFDNLNVDLILGLPNATKGQLNKDLDNLLSLPITHLSCYSLSVNPHTVFFIKGIKPQDSDIERDLYDIVNERMEKEGFIHYEISNWAKPGYESKHNYTYWKDETYYGIGMGASGYIDNVRYTNTKSINDYLDGVTIIEKEKVSKQDDKEYFLMLNLRTIKGIDLKLYKDKFDENLLEKKKETIEGLISKGLMIYNEKESALSLSFEGMMILDSILMQLIEENEDN